MNDEEHLNCCDSPSLLKKKVLTQSYHDYDWLMQCKNCNSYWYHRFIERVNYSGGPDDIVALYSQLSNEEAEIILNSTDYPDLEFLKSKKFIVIDETGSRVVKGNFF